MDSALDVQLIICVIYTFTVIVQWHSLDKAEQSRYYEMARREKELHRKRYPTWSARDNYAMHSRRRRKRLDHRPLLRRDGLCDDDGKAQSTALLFSVQMALLW